MARHALQPSCASQLARCTPESILLIPSPPSCYPHPPGRGSARWVFLSQAGILLIQNRPTQPLLISAHLVVDLLNGVLVAQLHAGAHHAPQLLAHLRVAALHGWVGEWVGGRWVGAPRPDEAISGTRHRAPLNWRLAPQPTSAAAHTAKPTSAHLLHVCVSWRGASLPKHPV